MNILEVNIFFNEFYLIIEYIFLEFFLSLVLCILYIVVLLFLFRSL